MKLSYWEYKTWLAHVDFTIIGSGIVGLSCALELKKKYPRSKVVVLERGSLPQGASTKNAGFACFGSISEIHADLQNHTEEEIFNLVKRRFEGIQLLRSSLGDDNLSFEQHGGHELFLANHNQLYEQCRGTMSRLNTLLKPIFGNAPFVMTPNLFGFKGVHETYITHRFEGQLDTGSMMQALLKKCHDQDISILNGIEVVQLEELGDKVKIDTLDFDFTSTKVFVATNGFASKLISAAKVIPARAQVLITKPIKNLKIKGTFHLDEGYYYFRNIDGRILLGGGRNLDFAGEQTMEFGQTGPIQQALEKLLRTVIIPDQKVEVDHSWSGIMGVGPKKSPIVKQVSSSIYCGVRLGGMGVALGSLVGKELADLANQ